MRFYVLHFEIGIREGQWGATGSLEDAETVTDELGMSEKAFWFKSGSFRVVPALSIARQDRPRGVVAVYG